MSTVPCGEPVVKAESFVPPTEGAETRILWLGIFSVRDGPLNQGVLDKKLAKPLDQGMLDWVGKVFMKIGFCRLFF